MERSLRVPKQIHIPLGYEFDRIVTPLLEYESDCAILLDYASKDSVRGSHTPNVPRRYS